MFSQFKQYRCSGSLLASLVSTRDAPQKTAFNYLTSFNQIIE